MKHLALCSVALVLTGGAALAQLSTTSLIADYQAQGFTRVEVRSGPTQTKVEAIRGTEKVEIVLDNATGSVLKAETDTVGAFEDTAPGVSVRNRNRDFLRVSSANDDSTDDGATNDDEDEDQVSGSDDGPDHDAGDDNDGDDGSQGENDDDQDGDNDDGAEHDEGSGGHDAANHDSGSDNGSD